MIIRVAAGQCAIGADPSANLLTVLRVIDLAAEQHPQVVVLPEFCNHLSVYDSAEHAWAVALDLDTSEWVPALAERATRHDCWLQVNVTVRRSPASAGDGDSARITNTNLLVGPGVGLVAANDKTVLMGAEGIYLSPSDAPSQLVETPFALLGSYACMDGVVPEVPRLAAVRGAQLMLNSLNSFARDEADLHIPVRAAENRVWVVSACKVGPLLPVDQVEAFSAGLGVPREMLNGAGESQIVAPDGRVVAIAPHEGEAVIVADIDLAENHRPRPDGTDLGASRRPAIYRALAEPTPPLDAHPRADSILAAAAHDLDEVARAIAAGAQLVVLAEGVGFEVAELRQIVTGTDAVVVATVAGRGSIDGADHAATIPGKASDTDMADTDMADTDMADTDMADTGAGDTGAGDTGAGDTGAGDTGAGDTGAGAVRAAVVEGLVIGAAGVIGRQPMLHRAARYHPATVLGDGIAPVDLPWGRLAVLVGDDHLYPEAARLAALGGVDVIAAPIEVHEEWETRLGLVERAAENRVCLVAATRRESAGPSLVVTLPADFTLWAPSRERAFDGTINRPDVSRDDGTGPLVATIHPARAVNRQISRNTNLVDGRPWQLCGALTE